MGSSRFFRYVWKLNGIGILLLLIFILGIGGYHIVKELFPHELPAAITNVAQDPQGDEKWTLGSSEEIEGTEFLYLPLVSERKNISIPEPGMAKKALRSYGPGYFAPSRNILFVNRLTGEMRWLFKDNKQLISNVDFLSIRKRDAKDRKVDAILYMVITRDTNGDNKLDSNDKADIALSLPDGSRYKEVIRSVERIFGTMIIGGREVLVLYQSEGKGFAATVRLADMSVHNPKEMPKVEQAP